MTRRKSVVLGPTECAGTRASQTSLIAEEEMGGIFLIQTDGKLVEMKEELYKSEDVFQSFLAEYPNLLAGDQIDSEKPRRWLLIAREVVVPAQESGTGQWSLDHLFVDQDGIPTLVEVKRSTDTRIRREVVGQMLDYAANAVAYWPLETLRSRFDRTCADRHLDGDQVLREFLTEAQDIEQFWQSVKTNLQAGRVRMLFVADQIPSELKRIVEFLNEQMDPAEVLAVELRQYVSQGLRTLVPRVFGQTAEAERRKTVSPRGEAWTEDRFFEALQAKGETVVAIGRKIYEWSQHNTSRIWWGHGLQFGSFVPELEFGGFNYQPFAVFTSGQVNIYFQYFRTRPPFESEQKRLELLSLLNSFLPKKLPIEVINRQPGISMADIAKGDAGQKFLKAFDWFVDEIKKANP